MYETIAKSHSSFMLYVWFAIIAVPFMRTFRSNMRVDISKLPMVLLYKRMPWVAAAMFGKMPDEWRSFVTPEPSSHPSEEERAISSFFSAAAGPTSSTTLLADNPLADLSEKFRKMREDGGTM